MSLVNSRPFVRSATSNGSPNVLEPLDRGESGTKTSDRAFEAITGAIRDLRILPGAALSETELGRQLGVSRTPVREAIARLVEVDLVTVVPQVGTRVSRIRISDAHEARFVRESLEVACVKIVCRLAVRDVSQLRIEIQAQAHAQRVGNVDEFAAADDAMHLEIFRLSGYPGAWRAAQRKKIQLDRMRRLSLPQVGLQELIDEHTAIVDAIERGATARCVTLVKAHTRRIQAGTPQLRHLYPDYFE